MGKRRIPKGYQIELRLTIGPEGEVPYEGVWTADMEDDGADYNDLESALQRAVARLLDSLYNKAVDNAIFPGYHTGINQEDHQ